MKLGSHSPRKKARLEIIPLIDIMFFLVATFMMVSLSMIKNQGIDVNLPLAGSGTELSRNETATLTLSAKGELFFNKTPLATQDLESTITQYRLEYPKGTILINADKDARMGQAIEILDKLRLLGVTNVAFQTQAFSSQERSS